MRTTLDIDRTLLETAKGLALKKTKAATVNEALQAYIRLKKLEGLLALEGKIQIDDDWAKLERRELEAQRRAFRRRR